MNQMQIRYTQKRAQEILNRKLTALKEKFTTQEVSMTSTEKLKALESGDFTTDFSKSKRMYQPWHYCIKFNKEIPSVFDSQAYDKEAKRVQRKYDELNDELVLGDNQEALKLLAKFEEV